MKRKLFIIFCIICFIYAVFAIGFADEKKEEKKEEVNYDYIGAKKCKICHKKDGTFPSWEETPHATAWDNVDTLKLADEKKQECQSCHATGVTKKGDLLTGVECEACHGPGSEYKSKSIMEDREKSIANGLLIPDENTCLGCHNKEKAPEEFHANMPDKFDFEKMKANGIHTLPEKEAEE